MEPFLEWIPRSGKAPLDAHHATTYTGSVRPVIRYMHLTTCDRTSSPTHMAQWSPLIAPEHTLGSTLRVRSESPLQPAQNFLLTAPLDSSFYYTCCQDFDLHIYDTKAPILPPRHLYGRIRDHTTSMALRKTIRGIAGQWTITDSHLSPDNTALIYSSLVSNLEARLQCFD